MQPYLDHSIWQKKRTLNVKLDDWYYIAERSTSNKNFLSVMW